MDEIREQGETPGVREKEMSEEEEEKKEQRWREEERE